MCKSLGGWALEGAQGLGSGGWGLGERDRHSFDCLLVCLLVSLLVRLLVRLYGRTEVLPPPSVL